MANKWTIGEILDNAKKESVDFVYLQFTGLFGDFKHIEIPVIQLERALTDGIMFDGSSISGFTKIQESDLYLRPDYSTWLVLPNSLENSKYTVARLFCDIYLPTGEPFENDPRFILKSALEEAKELGFDGMYVGPEPEFFLFELEDYKKNGALEVHDAAGYFDFAPFDKGKEARRDISKVLSELDFEMEALHHEVAQGQHEVDFKYSDGLSTADNIQTFKHVVKNVAAQHGLKANFMPKPKFGINGSGMHCNISLFKDGKNVFYDVDDHNQLSDVAYHFIAGLLKHARANAAFTNPIVNSYKRLVPGYEAPIYAAWSTSNRSCMIRIPAARGSATRVEVRNPDPAANPYLALAVLLKAGLEGIKNQYEVPREQKSNLYHMTAEERISLGIESLPGSLEEAIDSLLEDRVIREMFTETTLNAYVSNKENEWNEYAPQHSKAEMKNEVFQWELDMYVES